MQTRVLKTLMGLLRLGVVALCVGGLAAAQEQAAPQPFLIRLMNLFPPGYADRFGGVQVLADPGSGYGVRGFPLPFRVDARATFVDHPAYLEYSMGVRYHDTSFVAGRFENPDAGATLGVGHLEVTHNPGSGWQYGLLAQDQGRSSRATVGYVLVDGPVRLLSELGYGVQGAVRTPYVHLETSGGGSLSSGPWSVGVGSAVRGYVYPQQGQFSVDLSGSLTLRPDPHSTVTLSHFERWVLGDSALPDLAVGRYNQTNLDVVLSPDMRLGLLSLRNVQYHYQRSWLNAAASVNGLAATVRADPAGPLLVDLTPHYDWVAHEAGVRADLYYRAPWLSVLVGPSVDYLWGAGGGHWNVGLRVGVK